jgi:hypothetical protein
MEEKRNLDAEFINFLMRFLHDEVDHLFYLAIRIVGHFLFCIGFDILIFSILLLILFRGPEIVFVDRAPIRGSDRRGECCCFSIFALLIVSAMKILSIIKGIE